MINFLTTGRLVDVNARPVFDLAIRRRSPASRARPLVEVVGFKTQFLMNRTIKLPICPACKQGCLHPALRTRTFHPGGKAVEVQLLTSRCDHCEVQTTRADQHDENLRRLAARKASYGGLLMGEEILSLRKRYGLTQQVAAKIFGTIVVVIGPFLQWLVPHRFASKIPCHKKSKNRIGRCSSCFGNSGH